MFATLSFRRKAMVQLIALCVVLPLCALALRPMLQALDWGQVRLAWNGISLVQWCCAILATAASFACLGRYDVIIHRVLNTGISARAAQASGAAAVALSQTLGLGVFTGTLARWRGVPDLSIVAAGSVTALVSLSFLGAWLMLFALSGLLTPHALPLPPLVFQASLFSALCFILYTALKRYISLAGRRLRLPSLRAIGALMIYAALDTGFATLALWALLPEGASISLNSLFPIYLACLGASLIGNTPGGLGPFEVTFIWALQMQNVNELLAGLIAFRVVYFALPACLAMLYLVKPIKEPCTTRPMALRARGLHAEIDAALQSGGALVSQNGTMIGAVARTSQTCTLVFEPAFDLDESRRALAASARAHATWPLFYKCSARTALLLRKRGMIALRIARDAVLDLSNASLQSPSRRSLRRKIRASEKAGIRIHPLDFNGETLRAAAEIDRLWQIANGAARGFSMGRFAPEYLQKQAVFGAWQDGDLIAYISCHRGAEVWALDIMRHRRDVPNGTMHALVWRAIEQAQDSGCAQFSLASASCTQAPVLRLIDRLSFRKMPKSEGLEQFKRSFAPRWQPLYAVAPSRLALGIGLWDIWQEVQDPPPLRQAST